MAKRSKKNETQQRFDEKLVLNQWLLSLFDTPTFEKLAERLRPLDLEGLDENNVHRFHKEMKILWEFEEFPGDTLLTYDQGKPRRGKRVRGGKGFWFSSNHKSKSPLLVAFLDGS